MFKNALLNFKKTALKSSILMVAVLFAGIVQAQDPAEGETLFKQNCTSCHAVKRKVVGPALAGVQERWADKALLVKFIQNSQAVINGGDAYSKELYAKYNNTVMPAHAFLSDAQVGSILAYVDVEANKVEEVTADAGKAGEGAGSSEDGGISATSIWTLILVIAILFGIILVMNRVIGTLERTKR
jgi:cytochrome c551/c552